MRIRAILSIIFSLFMLPAIAQHEPLPPAEFATKSKQPGVQLLDVRTVDEYRAGHISQSVLADWKNASQFKQYVQYLDKTKPIYVYCAGGVRSKAAATWLRDNGYTNVFELAGGLSQWKDDKRPVEGMPDTPPISLSEYNRQVADASPALVSFSASWCPPCIKMEPVIQQLQTDLPNNFNVVKIDAGTQAELMKEVNVTEIPTYIFYKNGKEVWRKTGVVELQELKKAIQK